MKKWEEEQRKKNHVNKIKNAKSQIPIIQNINNKMRGSMSSDSKSMKDVTSQGSQRINDYFDSEKMDLNQIPLYRILKLLISRGYGYDIMKFNYLTNKELEVLIDEIKILPGHKIRFLDLINYIGELIPSIQNDMQSVTSELQSPKYAIQNQLKDSQSPQTQYQKSQKQYSQTQSNLQNKKRPISAKQSVSQNTKKRQINPYSQQQKQQTKQIQTKNMANKNQKQKPKQISPSQKQQIAEQQNVEQQIAEQQNLQYIGVDYFADSDDGYGNFAQTLDQILNRYKVKPQEIQQNQKMQVPKEFQQENANENILVQKNQNQIKKNNDTKQNNFVVQTKNGNQQIELKQNINKDSFKKKQQNSVQNNQKAKDDISLIPYYDENSKKTNFIHKENNLIRNLKKYVVEQKVDKNIFKINLELEKIRDMYLSYDGGKLTSTIVNLDIEEMSFCLACAIFKHIENFESTMQFSVLDQSNIKRSTISNVEGIQKRLAVIKEEFSGDNYEKRLKILEKQYQIHMKTNKKDQKLENNSQNPIEEPTYLQESFHDQQLDQLDVKKYMDEDTEGKQQLGREYSLKSLNDKQQIDSQRKQVEEILRESMFSQNKNEQFQFYIDQQSLNDQEEVSSEEDEVNQEQINEYYQAHKKYNKSLAKRLEESAPFQVDVNLSGTDDGQLEGEGVMEGEQGEYELDQKYQNDEQYQDQDNSQSYQEEDPFQKDLSFQDQNYETDLSQVQSSMNFSRLSVYTQLDHDKFQNNQSMKKNKNFFKKTFTEDDEEEFLKQTPTKEMIQNFCKNILSTSKMEKEIPIICLVYIERLIVRSGMGLCGANWRKILFTSLIMASKIWDDESFENENFALAFPIFTTRQINEMERVFLDYIDYNLYVKSSEYAKYYFILRTFAEKNKKSFPLRALDLKTILYLQGKSNKVEKNLKDKYLLPLNRSF